VLEVFVTKRRDRKAAEGGVVRAQHFLGVMYSTQQQYTEAGQWYRLAAEQGSVFSQTALGLLYQRALIRTHWPISAARWT
jgi:hypothetical protein